MQAPVAFYCGLMLVLVGLAGLIWDIFPPRGKIRISLPVGGSIDVDIPAVFVMTLGAILMILSPKTLPTPTAPLPPPVLSTLEPSKSSAPNKDVVTDKTAPVQPVVRHADNYHVKICTGDDPSWCGPVNLFVACPNRPVDELSKIACKFGSAGLPTVAISGGGECGKSVVDFSCKGE